jgi:flavin-dependent dehydrogenase
VTEGATASTAYDADVIVIGGGPAGSTAATALAQRGFHVVLLEREHFPREHIGESLLPASMPFLEWLGVLPRIEEAAFLPKWGATMVWGRGREPWSWYFRETNQRYPHTYQVWRADFDKILLDNSRAQGVEVREGCRVTAAAFDCDRLDGLVVRMDGGAERRLRSRLVVDASGQAAVLGRHLNLRRWDPFFRNLAVYGYFSGAARLPEPDENNLLVESFSRGWTWNIPLHTGLMSVGAVIDAAQAQQQLSRLSPKQLLLSAVARAPRTAAMLSQARLVSPARVVKDWSYITDEVVGDGYILAGDAACFVDPLFSSGVHLAMMSGAMAAAYAATLLRNPAMAGPAARFYKESYYQEYDHFRALARLFYATNRSVESYFWQARRLLDGEGEGLTPRQAFLRLVGGRPPRGYERVVIEAGELPAGFAGELGLLEAAASSRRAEIERFRQAGRRDSLLERMPALTPGVRLQRQPELRDGEFGWGYALSREGERLGRPCDELVAALASRIDGATTVAALLGRIGVDGSTDATAKLRQAALLALEELYAEEMITGLAEG